MSTEYDELLRKKILTISYGVEIPNEARDAVGTKLWLDLSELESIIQSHTDKSIKSVLERLLKESESRMYQNGMTEAIQAELNKLIHKEGE